MPVDDNWASGNAYEPYVGRWSRLVADEFLDWLAVPPGGAWLDVGCGTGALSEAILARCAPSHVLGIDPSQGFIDYARRRLAGEPTDFRVGDALELGEPEASRDAVVSGLVLNFVPDAPRAVAQMAAVARVGGVVADYVWDYEGMGLMRHFWEAAADIDPTAVALNESTRFGAWQPDLLERLFADLDDVATREIVVPTPFRDFDDYWTPFLGGMGAAPSYLAACDEATRDAVREALRDRVPTRDDGSIALTARAWAVRATR